MAALDSDVDQVRHVKEPVWGYQVQDLRIHNVNTAADLEGQFWPLLNRANPFLLQFHDPVWDGVFERANAYGNRCRFLQVCLVELSEVQLRDDIGIHHQDRFSDSATVADQPKRTCGPEALFFSREVDIQPILPTILEVQLDQFRPIPNGQVNVSHPMGFEIFDEDLQNRSFPHGYPRLRNGKGQRTQP